MIEPGHRLHKRRRTVRRAWWVLLMSLPIVLIAACSSGTSSGSSGNAPLSIAVLDWQKPVFQTVVAAYEKAHPTAKVDLRTLAADDTSRLQELLAQKASNSLACIVVDEDDQATTTYQAGVTTNLVPFLSKNDGLSVSDFVPAPLSNYRPLTAPSKITGLPLGIDATVVLYNKALFKEAGVALPTANWTWADMIAKATAITKAGHGKYYGIVGGNPASSDGNPWQAVYNAMIEAYGSTVYDHATNTSDIGSPAAVRAWQNVLQVYQAGVPYDIAAAGKKPLFESGKVAMEISVRALIPTVRASVHVPWDVESMPTVNGGKRPVGGGSLALSISSDCHNTTAAWKFITWFFSNTGGMVPYQNGYAAVPSTYTGLQSGPWLKLPGPPDNVAAFAEAAKDIKVASDMPTAAAVTTLANAIQEATQKVEIDHVSIATAFMAAQQQVNAVLAQSKT